MQALPPFSLVEDAIARVQSPEIVVVISRKLGEMMGMLLLLLLLLLLKVRRLQDVPPLQKCP